MRTLSPREEQMMMIFWKEGAMFIRDLIDLLPEPKPHYNTVSTIIRTLEQKGFVGHKVYGNTHQYYAIVSQSDYKGKALRHVVSDYFGNSYTNVVSSLIEDETLSIDELKDLISRIEQGK